MMRSARLRQARFALAGAALFALAGILPAAPPESDPVAAAQAAAKGWLAEIDAGRYGDSWEHASTLMRKAISRADWEKAASSVRGSVGALKSRTVQSATYTKTLPGAPDGEYVVIVYDAKFEKANAVETVTPMREKDGSWKVSGYYVKPPA
jgi:predicted transcriptional regulator